MTSSVGSKLSSCSEGVRRTAALLWLLVFFQICKDYRVSKIDWVIVVKAITIDRIIRIMLLDTVERGEPLSSRTRGANMLRLLSI